MYSHLVIYRLMPVVVLEKDKPTEGKSHGKL